MTMTSVPSVKTISGRGAEVKAPTAFRTISEVSSSLDVPQHVLRFWESKFQQVRPMKRGGGRRYYRPEDVTLLSDIKDLLYNQGFTIRGVQKLLRGGGRAEAMRATVPAVPSTLTTTKMPEVQAVAATSLSASARREMESVLGELKALRELLRQSGV